MERSIAPSLSLERLLLTAAALNEYADNRGVIITFLLDALRALPQRLDFHVFLAEALLRDLQLASMIEPMRSLFGGQGLSENRVLRQSVVRGLRKYVEENSCSLASSSQRS